MKTIKQTYLLYDKKKKTLQEGKGPREELMV